MVNDGTLTGLRAGISAMFLMIVRRPLVIGRCDFFSSAVNEHVPKYRKKNVGQHPWIGSKLL